MTGSAETKEKKAKTRKQACMPRVAHGAELARSQEAGSALKAMISVFLRGDDEETGKPRAALLVQNLWNLATKSENENVRLAASNIFLDREMGKPTEHKEVRQLKIEGVVYLPAATDIKTVMAADAEAQVINANYAERPLDEIETTVV